MLFRTPRYIQGGNLLTTVPGLGFFSANNVTISGNTITGVFHSTNGFTSGDADESQYFGLFAQDFYVLLPVTLIAGADTVVSGFSYNGTPGNVICQTNTGGYVAAIVVGYGAPYIGGNIAQHAGTPGRILVNTTGTAPTAASIGTSCWCLRYPTCDWSDASSTAADTARTLTIPEVTTSHRVIATSINDVGTANSCTWSGTAGVSETDDGSVGSARLSHAQGISGTGTSRTVISTYAVTSVNGIAMAAAMFRLK